uniref:Uncharacterized protein n=1 Tax=Nelumbo nucifera TaxID=4432 RepID=A0A822YDI4_NELNU|nr:TPA_asm: hypothetical protein HUJ06_030503 [Nelumbo nucifera]
MFYCDQTQGAKVSLQSLASRRRGQTRQPLTLLALILKEPGGMGGSFDRDNYSEVVSLLEEPVRNLDLGGHWI